VCGARGFGGYGLLRFFLQGELQEEAYRESLSEACVVLEALVVMVWAKRLERKLRDLLWLRYLGKLLLKTKFDNFGD